MNAIMLTWGGDLATSSTGDIYSAPVLSELQNRLIRRLLTSPGDYIWSKDYGAGLGGLVGKPSASNTVKHLILSQLQSEPLVATNPSPLVSLNAASSTVSNGYSVTIQYQIAGAIDNTPSSLQLTV